jgi:hypothetical protein
VQERRVAVDKARTARRGEGESPGSLVALSDSVAILFEKRTIGRHVSGASHMTTPPSADVPSGAWSKTMLRHVSGASHVTTPRSSTLTHAASGGRAVGRYLY